MVIPIFDLAYIQVGPCADVQRITTWQHLLKLFLDHLLEFNDTNIFSSQECHGTSLKDVKGFWKGGHAQDVEQLWDSEYVEDADQLIEDVEQLGKGRLVEDVDQFWKSGHAKDSQRLEDCRLVRDIEQLEKWGLEVDSEIVGKGGLEQLEEGGFVENEQSWNGHAQDVKRLWDSGFLEDVGHLGKDGHAQDVKRLREREFEEDVKQLSKVLRVEDVAKFEKGRLVEDVKQVGNVSHAQDVEQLGKGGKVQYVEQLGKGGLVEYVERLRKNGHAKDSKRLGEGGLVEDDDRLEKCRHVVDVEPYGKDGLLGYVKTLCKEYLYNQNRGGSMIILTLLGLLGAVYAVGMAWLTIGRFDLQLFVGMCAPPIILTLIYCMFVSYEPPPLSSQSGRKKEDLQVLRENVKENGSTLPEDICDELKDLCKNLYDQNGKRIKAVACLNDDSFDLTVISDGREIVEDFILKQLKDYEKYIRHIDIRSVHNEGYIVMHSDIFMDCIDSDNYLQDMDKIDLIIANNSKALYANTQHVNSVFSSPVRSEGYMANNHELLKEPCIVVYVDVKFDKGRIPIDGVQIPSSIEGVKTDVREGMAVGFMNSDRMPSECNTRVRPGCEISTLADIQTGSLGPLVDMGNDKTGFLTSLHVLVSKNLYKECYRGEPIDINSMPNRAVSQGQTKVGNIAFLKASRGSEIKPGFEAAVVELDAGISIDDNDEENPIKYISRDTYNMTVNDRRATVEKVGASTVHTTGRYLKQDSTNITMYVDDDDVDDGSFEFKDQHLIIGSKGSKFAEEGDSGSLVIIRKEEPKVVGIVIGGWTDGRCLVTPIKPIVDELMNKKSWVLKTFQTKCCNNGKEEPMEQD